MSAVASEKLGPEVLLIFLGHSSDADALADAIYNLERDLQRLLDQHLSVSSQIPFKTVRVWEWRKDGLPLVGGQDQIVAAAIKRANIAVFVFKERIGSVSWDELNQSRNREDPAIPVLAFFPTDSPADLNDEDRIAKWLDLVKKRGELVKDWSAPNSKALRPMEKYKDAAHLTTLAVEQLGNAIVSLLKCQPAAKNLAQAEIQPTKFLGDHSHLSYDRQPVLSRSLDELDQDSLKELLAKPLAQDLNADLQKSRDGSGPAVSEQLENLGCLYAGRPTLGAFLCFAPAKLLTDKSGCCTLQMAIHDASERGGERAPMSLARGNLLLLYKRGMSWLTGGTVLRRRGQIGSGTRDDLEIPEIVLREALANALVHRDYESKMLQDQPTRIDVYPDKVEITSYGLLLNEVPIELLNSPNQSLRPFRRNPVIAGIFQCMTLAELNASGVQRMRRVMTAEGLALPLFRTSENFVCVTLARPFELSSPQTVVPSPPSLPRATRKAFVCSTSDLAEHRKAARDACLRAGVLPIMWEETPAFAEDVRSALMRMIDDADLFILILGNRYGSIAGHDGVSFTELEFNRAVDRGLPIIVFTMHRDHPVTVDSISPDADSRSKLTQFKNRVSSERLVVEFKSPEDLRTRLIEALASIPAPSFSGSKPDLFPGLIPKPPAFYAEPDYIGSHKFVGRAAELHVLTDWAAPSDPTNLLLFEAIGGGGKSMLTWKWTTDPSHALAARPADKPWAGRFWYSFYEGGASMDDFCRHTLAYMTSRPLEDFAKKKTAELMDELLSQLHAKPWLLILDGLERVLVAYHRIDAAEVPDEEANAPTDKIVNRNPSDATRDEDNDLLRALAAAAPSKLLVSSRLTPRVLLNPSGQTIPGAKRITLPGLRPPDAEALLRSCGIEGNSAAIQSYLTTNCDNHPLVIGILGGVIANYLPARGDFDAWAAAPDGGAALDLTRLDLIQRRNHILRSALDSLPPESRRLLSTLALLSESVDYETLKAFDPHHPSDEKKLASVSRDLEQRGLLKFDGRTRRYELHPVVRGVMAGVTTTEEKERYGKRVVDHFSALPHRPYEEAETLEDVHSGLQVVRTLLKLCHYQQAADAYAGDLSYALLFNLNAYAETLSLLKPFFPNGWGELPKEVDASHGSYLANSAAIALDSCGEPAAALAAYGAALRAFLEAENWRETAIRLRDISTNLPAQNRLGPALRTDSLALEVATLSENKEGVFMGRLFLFADLSKLGQWAEAATTWSLLDPMGRDWSRAVYRPGRAEQCYAEFHFWQGSLQEVHLAEAERLAAQGKDRKIIRSLHRLRGDWRLTQGEWALAAASYQEAVRLARDTRSVIDAASETGLALAKHHLGQLANPREEAERLAQLRNPAHRLLAQLWLALGDAEQAKKHALKAYTWAWADGEPFVHRYELTQTTELLRQMNVPIPNLPPYNPAKDERLPWEDEVRAAIEKLRAKKKAKKGKAE